MPKEEKDKPKKKMVVVEEVEEVVETPKAVEETPKVVEDPKVVEEVKTEEVTPTVVVSSGENSQEIVEESEKTNYLWIIIPTALLIGALVGGLITYFSGLSRLSSEVSATPTPVASIAPEVQVTATPSPKSNFDRSLIKLQVLNGSSVSGLAGKAKTYLEGLGYKDVVAGNASVSNMTETTISLKDSKKELLENIISDLSKNYKLSEKTETLPASSKYDFVITLGSK